MKPKNTHPAFTLLEMVLVLAVIAVISGFFWANYYSGEKRSELMNAQNGLISNLRLAQAYSLAGKQYGSRLPLGGWGVHLNKASSTYIFFADLDGNQIYDAGEASAVFGGKTHTWPDGTAVYSIFPGDIIDITFSVQGPPRANIYDGASTSSEAVITLNETENNTTGLVRVGEAGLISDR